MKVLFSILVMLVLAAPASAQMRKDIYSSRSLAPTQKVAMPISELKELVPNYKFFIAIGRCEQPGDGRWGIYWKHPGPTYPGGLGVFAPLWTEQGIEGTDLAATPNKATPIEQMIHSQRIIDKYGVYAWGCTGRALAQAPFYENVKAPSRKEIRRMRMVWKF